MNKTKNKCAIIPNPPLTLIQCCAEAILTKRIYSVQGYIPLVKRIYRAKGEGGKEKLSSFTKDEITATINSFLDILDYLIDNKYLSEDFR